MTSAVFPVPPAADEGRRASSRQATMLAVQRLLTLRGIRTRIDDLDAHCPAQTDAAWLARTLAAHGVFARVVNVPPDGLTYLRRPALLCMNDGATVLLNAVGPRRVCIEDGRGRNTWLPASELLARYTGVAVEPTLSLRDVTSVFRGWLALLVSERTLALEALGLSLALSLLALLSPWLTGLAVDRALPDSAPTLLLLLAVAVALTAVQQGWLGYLRQRCVIALDARVQTTALRESFVRLLARPYLEVAERTVGEQTQYIDSTERATYTPAEVTFLPALDLMVLASHVAGLCLVSFHVGVVASLLLLASLSIAGPLASRATRLEHERTSASARARSLLHELISGVMAIKAAGASRACVARWLGLLVDERTLGLRRERLELGVSCLLLAAQHAATLSVIGIGGSEVLEGSLSLGGLAMAFMYADGLGAASTRLSQAIGRMATLAPHLRRMQIVLSQPAPAQRPAVAPPAPHDDDDAIVLDDVWFRYHPSHPWILEGYSLRVKRGAFLHLHGVSGQGKTTVLRLIAGLLTPERGTVRVGGKPTGPGGERVAYLPQDAHLLEGSILANLMLMSGKSPDALMASVQATGLDEWLRTLPMGLETVLPPGGGNLSGGQRQWIALTAAVASNRAILLLDEPTSHLDHARRKTLQLEQLLAGRTVVAVSHEG